MLGCVCVSSSGWYPQEQSWEGSWQWTGSLSGEQTALPDDSKRGPRDSSLKPGEVMNGTEVKKWHFTNGSPFSSWNLTPAAWGKVYIHQFTVCCFLKSGALRLRMRLCQIWSQYELWRDWLSYIRRGKVYMLMEVNPHSAVKICLWSNFLFLVAQK